MDGGGVGYTGIFKAKRDSRANGSASEVVPPFQPEPPAQVVKPKKFLTVSMSTHIAGPGILFTEASSVELLFPILLHRKR